jgi:biotin synthase
VKFETGVLGKYLVFNIFILLHGTNRSSSVKKYRRDNMLKEMLREEASILFQKARDIARSKDTIFSMSVPFTTHCKISPPCRHCRWRSMSKTEQSFGRDVQINEVTEKAGVAGKAGIQRIHMPSGWMGYDLPDYFYGFCGPINRQSLSLLKAAGIDEYWCGIEIPNEALFQQVRPGDDYRGRIRTLQDAKELGLKTMSGFLFGVGETQADIIKGIRLLKELEVDSVAISPLKPMPYTEMERFTPPTPYEWAKIVAITTIYLGNADMFTSPEIAHWGIRAGTNAFLPVFPKYYGRQATPGMEELGKMRCQVYNTPDSIVKEF